MKRFLFSFLFVCASVSGLFAQDDEVLLTIDGKPVTKAEFEYIYRKNNSNVYSEADKKSPKDYLELFIDFKLKVLEAENLKMDTLQSFKDELAGYRKEAAAPYLTDHNYDEQFIQEMYRRMTLELDASHILLSLPPDASAIKEKEVLDKIRKIRHEIIAGKNFAEAADEYSEDPSAKTNHGNLGYFTAFMMVYPFESAAYKTPVGEVSEPVRTQFGYHLVKVNAVRKNQGEILVAHIMKNIPKGVSPERKAQLKASIDSLYLLVKNGADFAELAKKESDDKRSAADGGKMPWFSAGRIIPSFSTPAFALKNIGDISEPIETEYGYHIIKKLDERPIASFDEMKEDIENRIKHDPQRSNSSQQVFIDKLKKQYHFTKNEKELKELDGLTVQKNSTVPNVVLFTLDSTEYSGKDFQNWAEKKKISTGSYLSLYNQWVNEEVLALVDSKLEDNHPEFKYLMQEYHDGMLLFNISQEKVWNYASEDTTGLQKFYSETKDKHMWNERFKGSIITCKNAEVHEEADELFSTEMTIDEVLQHLNADEEMITAETGAWEKGSNPVVDYYVWNGETPKSFDSEITFIRGDLIGPEPKKLDEARGLYIADYQKYLEEKWIKELRKKYKVKVDKKVLETIEGV
ncbi:MAG TPA: peptidylprolyl isomerase [Draconibacterium sp.]|nr:peptidylprolyl isomerase [Draconibacterium sp.]